MNSISRPPVSDSEASRKVAGGILGFIWRCLVAVGKWLAKCPPRHQPG